MHFDRIPAELKSFVNWCTWRYEIPEGSTKQTKVPYNPITGHRASSTDPQTWCSFAEAVEAANDWNRWAGIGFFFGPRDPYCGIDLDDPFAVKDDGKPVYTPEQQQEIVARQEKIFREFNSYSERSPSGKGLHIIIKASVPRGRRRDAVELYSTGRFFTMTGYVYHDAPIAERGELATMLWEQMAPAETVHMGFSGTPFQDQDDMEVFDIAASASNGDKFQALWYMDETVLSSLYPSSSGDGFDRSRADYALIDILAYYTQHQPQIARMFRNSPLGQRPKALRDNYVYPMIHKAFDNQLPPIDISGLLDSLKAATVAAHPPTTEAPAAHDAAAARDIAPARAVEVTGPPPARLSATAGAHFLDGFDLDYWKKHYPPGIVGMIADFVFRSSPRPVYEMALTSALGLFGGIVGRQFNVSGTGLNQYLMLVARTGRGKEAIARGISHIIGSYGQEFPIASEVYGPAELASGQAVLKYLSARKVPCCVALTGEIGIKLKQITHPNASSADATLRKVLLDLYNKSGANDRVQPSIYANKDNNTDTMFSPALTLIGESSPEVFYEALDETSVAAGLVPRFIIIEYDGPLVEYNDDHHLVQPAQQLLGAVEYSITYAATLAQRGTIINVEQSQEAKELLTRIRVYQEKIINANRDRSMVVDEIWNRVHVKTMKLAALLAVAHNIQEPIIDAEMVRWAVSLILTDTLRLVRKFDRGEMGVINEATLQEMYIKRELRKYINDDVSTFKSVDHALHKHGIVSRSWLQTRVIKSKAFRLEKQPTLAFNRAIDVMCENGLLRRLSVKELSNYTNKAGYHFVVADPAWLNADD